jgi:alkaline phosphatase
LDLKNPQYFLLLLLALANTTLLAQVKLFGKFFMNLLNIHSLPYVAILFLLGYQALPAQGTGYARVHSHNDYEQKIPFWKALSAGATSIEVDVYLKGAILYVAHEPEEIQEGRTLESLYLEPLGRAGAAGYLDNIELQVLIDVKTEAYGTLDSVIRDLKKHPALLSAPGLRFVISGNRPDIADYEAYPDFIWFDHQRVDDLESDGTLDRVALVSLNFRSVSSWNGESSLSGMDRKKIRAILEKVHHQGKPFRFWATPDTELAWRELARMGADFINTDKPYECVVFLNFLHSKSE